MRRAMLTLISGTSPNHQDETEEAPLLEERRKEKESD